MSGSNAGATANAENYVTRSGRLLKKTIDAILQRRLRDDHCATTKTRNERKCPAIQQTSQAA